jgi:folate-dependent phosphoribosylglycinamide formyltransferase PurN
MTANASESDQNGTTSDVRIAILSSDRGGHVQTLLEDSVVGYWVALVVAERPDAYAIRHAE